MRHLVPALASLFLLNACANAGAYLQDPDKALAELQEEGPEIRGVNESLLNQAQSAEKKGDYKAAAQVYQQLLDQSPQNMELGYAYAEALRKAGQNDAALNIYNKILKEKPDFQDAQEGRGLALLAKGEWDNASEVFASIMEKNPDRWRSLNGIGILFSQKNLYSEAKQYFNAALSKSPNNPSILNNLGLTQAMDRDFYTSKQTLALASKHALTPQQLMRTDLNLAVVHAISGDMKAAQTLAKEHLTEAQLHNNMGYYALLANDKDLARAHLQTALSQSKTYYNKAWVNLETVNSASRTAAQPAVKPKRLVIAPTPDKPQAETKVADDTALTSPTAKTPTPPSAPAAATTDEPFSNPPPSTPAISTGSTPTTPAETPAPLENHDTLEGVSEEKSSDSATNINASSKPDSEDLDNSDKTLDNPKPLNGFDSLGNWFKDATDW